MLVVSPGGKRRDLFALLADAFGPRLIVETQNCIGICDIEIGPDERHPEWRVETGDERHLHVGHSVSVRVAQQCDAVCAWYGRARFFHEQFHEEAFDPLSQFRLRRGGGFRHEHIAIGQDVEPAGVLQTAGKRSDRKPLRRNGCKAAWPTGRRRDIESRQEVLRRFGDLRGGTACCLNW